MSPRLRAYLALEELMLQLDELGDPVAEELRDAMDPVWYELTDEEHGWLNGRSLGPGIPPTVHDPGIRVEPRLLDWHEAVVITPQPGLAA